MAKLKSKLQSKKGVHGSCRQDKPTREELKASRDGLMRLKAHPELILVSYGKGQQEELLQPKFEQVKCGPIG